MLLKYEVQRNGPGMLFKLRPSPVQKVWDGAGEAALVTSSQGILTLLAQDPALGNRASLAFHVLPRAELLFPKGTTERWVDFP